MRLLSSAILLVAALASASAHGAAITVNGTFSALDPTVDPRTTRNGAADTCATPKAFPGTTGGTTRYQSYSFFNSGPAECVTVAQVVDYSSFGFNLFVIAYGPGGFNPSNASSNYLADAGQSGSGYSYTVNVGANSAFTLVAFDIFNADGNYTFSVTGDNLSRGSAVVPEPGLIALLSIGMLATVGAARRGKSRAT